MKKIIDWLFMDETSYFNKYVVPERLGRAPYLKWERELVRHAPTRPSPASRFMTWIFG